MSLHWKWYFAAEGEVIMFSIICIFNDEKTLKLNLLQSLNFQKTSFELILVDNRVPRPLTKALNEAALKTRGEFLMFAHQDVKLIGEDWLEKAERFSRSLKDLGAVDIIRLKSYKIIIMINL